MHYILPSKLRPAMLISRRILLSWELIPSLERAEKLYLSFHWRQWPVKTVVNTSNSKAQGNQYFFYILLHRQHSLNSQNASTTSWMHMLNIYSRNAYGCGSVAKSCQTLWDPNSSVHHYFLEFAQIHVHGCLANE